MLSNFTVTDPEGDEIKLPTRWEICSTCRGEGRSSAYLGAFSGEDMAEDPDFARDYMNGAYDRACDTCGGDGKVRAVDEDRLTPELLALYEEEVREEADYQSMCRMERRMGA